MSTEGMNIAFAQAQAAAARGEVPVGAAVLYQGRIIAQAGNRTQEDQDPTAHAEILALRAAAHLLGTSRLNTCDLYVTLEPLHNVRRRHQPRPYPQALLRRL